MEQADAGKGHHHPVFITAGNDQVIPDGAAGLGNVFYAALTRSLHIVGKREKGIAA